MYLHIHLTRPSILTPSLPLPKTYMSGLVFSSRFTCPPATGFKKLTPTIDLCSYTRNIQHGLLDDPPFFFNQTLKTEAQ